MNHTFTDSELVSLFEIARRAIDGTGIEYYEAELDKDLTELQEKLERFMNPETED